MDEFATWLRRRGRGRSAAKYCQIARRWRDDPGAIERRIASSRYSPSYRRNLVAALRVYARFEGNTELAAQLEDIRLPAPIPRDSREPLDRDDWFAVLDEIEAAEYLSEPQRAVCTLIALRGIRCNDVLSLERTRISKAIKTGMLSFESKGERWQHFTAEPLLPTLRELDAMEWRGKKRVRNLVCPRSREATVQASAGRSVRRAFDRIAAELELDPADLYAHRFRHTYATHFLQMMAGDPEAIFKLQTQMGWARLDTAASYLRRSRRDELDAVESEMLKR